MNVCTLTRRRYAALLTLSLLLPLAAAAAVEDAILLIDQTSGVAGVQRDGKRLALPAGAALQEQDLIVTDRSGRMTLRLGRHGFVEVGPNAEVGIERLPFAAYARDLKSIFSVSKGYFRVVWKHPQVSSNWPLYVYMAGHRVSLSSGEYFFHNRGESQTACVAAGQIALQAAGGEGVETIKPPACAQLAGTKPPVINARNPDDWIAVRRSFSIEATAATLLARGPSAPAPLPAAPAKPVIRTAPVAAVASASPPVAIAAASNEALPSTAPYVAPPSTAQGASLPAARTGSAPIIAAPAAPAPSKPAAVPASKAPAATPSSAAATITAPLIIGQVSAAPVTTKPVAAKTSGGWVLNVASYADGSAAEAEAARLRAAGYRAAAAIPATVNGKPWYRVQMSGYASEAEARAAALELKTQLGLQNIWVLKP